MTKTTPYSIKALEERSDQFDLGLAILCACDLCGCGNNEDAELLLEVLRWCSYPFSDDRKVLPPFNKRGCYCSGAHQLAAKVLDRAGLIEHGSGMGWPWLTSKGRKFLDSEKETKT